MDKTLLAIQANELTEFCIYQRIATIVKNPADRAIVEHMARQEKNHYELWKEITGQDVPPSYAKLYFYYVITRLFGLSFGLKLMEKGENLIVGKYQKLAATHPRLAKVIQEEQEHEQALLKLIDNKLLNNVGAVILGLNDALVELTGALAGFTLALGHTRLIGVVGLITGLAASLSMAASSYLSAKEDRKRPLSAAFATGGSYAVTVVFLILPYFIFTNQFVALGSTIGVALFIILAFNFYTAVSRDLPFGRRFLEMAVISLGVAAINFIIGYGIKNIVPAVNN